MNKIFITIGMSLFIGLSSCSSNSSTPPPSQPDQSSPPAATPPPPPAKTEAEKEKDGTNIKVDQNGVRVRTKDGERVNDVKIGKDSSSVEIKRPR